MASDVSILILRNYCIYAEWKTIFVGVTNNIENGVVLPGFQKGVCETSCPIQDTTAKDKWKDWVIV